MKVMVEREIPAQDIADLMVTAIEGGSNYWCAAVRLKTSEPARDDKEVCWYANPKVFEEPFLIDVVEQGGRRRQEVHHTCDRQSFERAFELMATKYPRHWADFVNENADSITADVFLQLAALGDIVYG